MKVLEFYNNLAELYPSSLSCPWDNDGLMCCPDPDKEVKKVLVCLDASLAALQHAADGGFDTVLCHHPMIFKPLKSLNSEDIVSRRVIFAIKNDISVISLHTRLDAGVGGVNDCLAEALGLENVTCFGDEESPTIGRIGDVSPCSGEEFARKIKNALGASNVTANICCPVSRVALVGGAGDDFALLAKKLGADTFVTGEAKHHIMLDMGETGLNVFFAGHHYTENPVTKTLYNLASSMTGAQVEIFDSLSEYSI